MEKSEPEKNYPVYADKDTHTALAVWAAKRKITIKKVLKELVEKAQKDEEKETA